MSAEAWTWDMPMNDKAPPPWGKVLSGLAVLAYACLAFLGWYSFTGWIERAQGGFGIAFIGVLAAAGIGLMAGICAVAKTLGWWMIEWVALWFVMSALSIHVFMEAFGPGYPSWFIAEMYFLAISAHRNISLFLFSRRARWGADRRHLTDPNLGRGVA